MNMTSFIDELALIKLSEVKQRKRDLARKVLGNIALSALGTGLGFGTGKILSEKVLPAIAPGLTAKQRRWGALGLTAMGGLAGILAGRAATKREQPDV